MPMTTVTKMAGTLLLLITLPNLASSTPLNLTFDVVESDNSFSWEDYCVLTAMLVISCGIGLFYGFVSEDKSSDDFLLGGSSMKTLPMAMSLATSFITAIELLGNPAEMYQHGLQYWMICLSFIVVMPIASNFYLPVFMKLRLISCFQYLEKRFSRVVKLVASGLYVMQMLLYTTVAVYAPALALNNVTGLNTYIAVSLIYVVCVIYSIKGGMKAVIMTDTFQTGVLICSLLFVFYYGSEEIGGLANIIPHNYLTGRLEIFNMNPDPTTRHTFWSVTIGGTFYWLSMFCANQASIQKYLSVSKISQARKALWFSCTCLIFIYTINFYTGMTMTAHYKDCDPIQSGLISAPDQLLPQYVLDVMGKTKGVPGFFVAGIFAASLGTVAAAITSISAVICQDFLTLFIDPNILQSKGAQIAKWISAIAGILSFSLVFIVERLGTVLQVALSFNGMVGGIILGLFTLGMFIPHANAKGAIVGATIAVALVTWIGVGSQIAIINGYVPEESKPVSIEGCITNETFSSKLIFAENNTTSDEVFFLYRLSYLWYSAIGCIVTFVFGWLVSILTISKDDDPVDKNLLSPLILILTSKLSKKIKDIMKSIKSCGEENNTNNQVVTMQTISESLPDFRNNFDSGRHTNYGFDNDGHI